MNVHWSSKPNRYRDALILCETVVNSLSILNFNRDKRKDKAKNIPTLIVRNVPGINIDLTQSDNVKEKKAIAHLCKFSTKSLVHNATIYSDEEYRYNGSFKQLVLRQQVDYKQ